MEVEERKGTRKFLKFLGEENLDELVYIKFGNQKIEFPTLRM